MQPDFVIDKCESIRDRVISLRLTDESGTIDDIVEVHVDYRDENLNVPNELNIALGYRETGVVPMGIYIQLMKLRYRAHLKPYWLKLMQQI